MPLQNVEDLNWTDCPWERPYRGNVDRVEFDAVHPRDGSKWTVRFSGELIQYLRGDPAKIYEAKHSVPEVLTNANSIFIGLDRDEEPLRWAIAYCGRPGHVYNWAGLAGMERWPVDPRLILVVYVDENREIYEWGWEPCDKIDTGAPQDWNEGRYLCRAR